MVASSPSRFVRQLLLLALSSAAAGCDSVQAALEGPGDEPRRIVAIGDVHGDLDAARAALRLAGAIDEDDSWIGGDLQVVQTGDILDRGDGEEEILNLFHRLMVEAEEVGGAVHILHGNHELMNVYLDFRYVTDGGFQAFSGIVEVDPTDSLLLALEETHRVRAAAFRPGGPLALALAQHRIALTLDGTLFTHAGVLPAHLDMGLDLMEIAVKDWLLGDGPPPDWIRGDMSPVWNRVYSGEPSTASCDTLSLVLERLGLDRMVVGHTVQDSGITAYCGGRLWCIDVGMAAHYGGRPEVLEIRGSQVRSLRLPIDP